MVRIIIVKHRGIRKGIVSEEDYKDFQELDVCKLCNGTGEIIKEVYDYDAHQFAPVEIVPCVCQYKDEFQSLIDYEKNYNFAPYDSEENNASENTEKENKKTDT